MNGSEVVSLLCFCMQMRIIAEDKPTLEFAQAEVQRQLQSLVTKPDLVSD